MRVLLALCVALVTACPARAQSTDDDKPPSRYGVELNLRVYPQGSAKQTLASVIEAYEKQRYPYVLAYLASPSWVDQRVKEVHNGDFEALVRVVGAKFSDDPSVLKEMKRFLKEGEWEGGETTATVKLKDVKSRQISFRKIGKLWYMENSLRAEEK